MGNYQDLKQDLNIKTKSTIVNQLRKINVPIVNNNPHLTFLEHLHGKQNSNNVLVDLLKMNKHSILSEDLLNLWNVNKTYSFAEYPVALLEALIIYMNITSLKKLNITVMRVLLNNIYRELDQRGLLDYHQSLSLEDFFVENLFHLINLQSCNIQVKKVVQNLEFTIQQYSKQKQSGTRLINLTKVPLEDQIIRKINSNAWLHNLLPYLLTNVNLLNFHVSEELFRKSIDIVIKYLHAYHNRIRKEKLLSIFEDLLQPSILEALEPHQKSVVFGECLGIDSKSLSGDSFRTI